MLAGYTIPEAERAASAGIPIPRLPKQVARTSGTLRWKNSVAGQIYNIDVPMTVSGLGVVAGSANGSVAIGDASIPSFATRFGSTFYEYCIVGGRVEIVVALSANPQGFVCAYVDEKSATPTSGKAQGSPHLLIPLTNTDDGRTYKIEWKAQDYDDLLWNPIGNSFNSAFVNFITGTSNFGTGATTTAQLTISGTLAVCFRGIRG